MKRKLFFIIVSVPLMLMMCFNCAYAHTTKQKNRISWGESIGWSIDER